MKGPKRYKRNQRFLQGFLYYGRQGINEMKMTVTVGKLEQNER